MTTTPVPVFAQAPNVGKAFPNAANTKSDGTGTIGTDIFLLWTPGANGSRLDEVQVMPQANTAGTSTQATILRLYLATVNSGALTPSSNVWLIREGYVPSVAADSTTVAFYPVTIPVGRNISTGLYLLCSMHHALAANTSLAVTAFGEDY